MKKILLFLTFTFIFILGNTKTVSASTKFYEAEMIDGIYLIRTDGFTNFYQQARFFRRSSDNQPAYCLQPFKTFQPNQVYETTNTPTIEADKLEIIKDIVNFGYLAENHQEPKWYAITQLLIWQELIWPANFYFTDTLNGHKIEPYQQEIKEIYDLIAKSKITPSFDNETYHVIKGQNFSLIDNNQVLNHFQVTSNNATIINNTLTIDTTKAGIYEINLTQKNKQSQQPSLFYQGGASQELMTVGSTELKTAKLTVIVDELELMIEKTTNQPPTNQTKLEESIFTLYDESMTKIKDIILDKNYKASISSNEIPLEYGTYYIQETKAGAGYELNRTIYPVIFSKEQTKINLVIENKMIESEIILQKYMHDKNTDTPEENAIFEIYDQDQQLITTLITNQEGIASTILPYGHYIIKQMKGKDNYTLVEPFEISIDGTQESYYYQLYDEKEEVYEIEVPNTGIHSTSSYLSFIIISLGYYYVQKKYC